MFIIGCIIMERLPISNQNRLDSKHPCRPAEKWKSLPETLLSSAPPASFPHHLNSVPQVPEWKMSPRRRQKRTTATPPPWTHLSRKRTLGFPPAARPPGSRTGRPPGATRSPTRSTNRSRPPLCCGFWCTPPNRCFQVRRRLKRSHHVRKKWPI